MILRSPLKRKNNVRNKDFFFDSFEQNQQNKQKVFRRWLILDRKRENRLCVFGNWFVGIDLKSSYKGAISIRNIFASIVHRQFLFPNQDFRFSIFKDLYNNSSQRRVNRRIFCFKILKNCLAQNLFTAINLWLILFYKRSKILRYISTRWSDSKFPYSSGCKNITT